MKSISYNLSEIKIAPPSFIGISGIGSGDLACLWVKEEELSSETEQNDISQGMFRALSLIIQLNYLAISSKPSCILIDDIGEGLDHERSCALIDLLISKAKKSQIQLIMTTNDRFVMNKVPFL